MAFIIVAQKTGYMNADVVDLLLSSAEPPQVAPHTTEKFPNKSVV